MDRRIWKAFINGWTPLKIVAEDNTESVNLEKDWTLSEDIVALENSRALNAIFNGADKNIFRTINVCTSAKEGWETLEVSHEGTSKVRMSRLRLLTTTFKNLKTREDETISNFNVFQEV